MNLLIDVRDLRRDYISAAGPFAEINGATPVAAEWKFSVSALDGFLADRTAKF